MYAFEPTPEEAAIMSKHVYGDKVELKGGWKVSSFKSRLQYTNKDTGFKSGLYERTVDGKTEYTYATAGTEDFFGKDGANNMKQLIGQSEQYAQSTFNAGQLRDKLGDAELTFTGHSLGGGLAEANSVATGDKGITFNVAGVSPFTKGVFGKSNVDAYIMRTDPLNFIQKSSPLVPTAGGNQIMLTPRSIGGVLNGHSIEHSIEALSKGNVIIQMLKSVEKFLIKPPIL